MPNEQDPGDEAPGAPAPPKRYYAVEEFHHGTDTMGLSHHICARDLMHALEVMSRADLCDAMRIEFREMDLEQAKQLWVRDDDHGGGHRFTFDEANLGDRFCEEY